MILKGIIEEDFINYKKPCMVLEFPKCDFKCDRECGLKVCQNGRLPLAPDIEIDDFEIINRYVHNPITQAIVFQGLEPFDSVEQIYPFITKFRSVSDDDIVIYTGYKESELPANMIYLKHIGQRNVIVKFGRFIPAAPQPYHYDEILGVELASDNQYAKRIC